MPAPSLLPAVAVTALLALSAARREPLLRLAAVAVAVIYVLAGLAVAVARSVLPRGRRPTGGH